MDKKITMKMLEASVVGGCVLGGGGGGSMTEGRKRGRDALKKGPLTLRSIEDFSEEDVVITASAVGAPAAKDAFATSKDFIKSVKILNKSLEKPVAGIITNENGGAATVNGWVQSSELDIPLIDAPCNGRAHPTGVMGSLSLGKSYISTQAFAGGDPKLGNYVEGLVTGSLETSAKLIREGAVQAGGLVAVARNPVKVKHIREHAAVGGISRAIELGECLLDGLKSGPDKAVDNVLSFLGGERICSGSVEEFELKTVGGFDVGRVVVSGYEMTFWNEYMTLENKGKMLYSFPDLIMTFSEETGYPVTTAEICRGMKVIVIGVDRNNIPLSTTMRNREILKVVEPVIGKKLEY